MICTAFYLQTVRAVLGLFVLSGLAHFQRSLRPLLGSRHALWHSLITASQFHLPFYITRYAYCTRVRVLQTVPWHFSFRWQAPSQCVRPCGDPACSGPVAGTQGLWLRADGRGRRPRLQGRVGAPLRGHRAHGAGSGEEKPRKGTVLQRTMFKLTTKRILYGICSAVISRVLYCSLSIMPTKVK